MSMAERTKCTSAFETAFSIRCSPLLVLSSRRAASSRFRPLDSRMRRSRRANRTRRSVGLCCSPTTGYLSCPSEHDPRTRNAHGWDFHLVGTVGLLMVNLVNLEAVSKSYGMSPLLDAVSLGV